MYRIAQPPAITGAGAWNDIVGWQNSGQPTNLYHGAYGGHQERVIRPNFAGFGGPPSSAPRYVGPYGYDSSPWGYGGYGGPWGYDSYGGYGGPWGYDSYGGYGGPWGYDGYGQSAFWGQGPWS